jgi:CpXC protein
MSSDRSIAEDRRLQCACGEWFDVLEWQAIDVAARLDLVLELARGEQRTHRCPACGIAHGRLTQLGLLVPSRLATVIAVVGESDDDSAQEPAWYASVQLQMLDEPVAFVNVPWDWIALLLTRDFDADLGDPAMARAQVAIAHGDEPADGYAGALQILGTTTASR